MILSAENVLFDRQGFLNVTSDKAELICEV